MMSYICDIPKKFCNLREKDGTCRLERPCLPIVDQCKGCDKEENGYCKAYIAPAIRWAHGRECPMATHIEREDKKKKIREKIRVGQQKQRR